MARPAHGKTGRRRRGTRRTLTPQMRRFLVEYLLGSSAKGAAVKAGYSRRTAKQGGHNVLHHPAVKRALARHLEHANLTAARTLEELRRLAFADVPSLYDDDHQRLPFSVLTPEQRSLIAGVETIVKNAEGGDGHTDRVLKLRGGSSRRQPRQNGPVGNSFSLELAQPPPEPTAKLEPHFWAGVRLWL